MGTFSFLFWGFIPLFWKQIAIIPAFEIMGFRIVTGFVLISAFILCKNQLGDVFNLVRKKFLLSVICAALILINWLTYVWAVNAGYIVETSLAYFINPLMSIFLGVLVLKERVRKIQWFCISLVFIGVSILFFKSAGKPWIALVVASSFALYGFVKKKIQADSMHTLAIESLILLPAGISYLLYIYSNSSMLFLSQSLYVQSLTLISGLATILPLGAFGIAARYLPLSTIGLLQYIAPTIQLLIGVLIYKEDFSQDHILSFSIIWISLIIFTYDGTRLRTKNV